MKLNFRLGWFRIEIFPRFKIVFDVRRTVAGKKPGYKRGSGKTMRTKEQIQDAARHKRYIAHQKKLARQREMEAKRAFKRK